MYWDVESRAIVVLLLAVVHDWRMRIRASHMSLDLAVLSCFERHPVRFDGIQILHGREWQC